MAEVNIPAGAPGIAGFESDSYKNHAEILFGDTPAVATKDIIVSQSTGTPMKLPLYSVVHIDAAGAISPAVAPLGVSNATHILAAPATLPGTGLQMSLPFYVAGHFRAQALRYGPDFASAKDKETAFTKANAPMILVSVSEFDTFAPPLVVSGL